MPYNEKTTMKPDGSKTVRKEHIDPSTGKCIKIEITEFPSPRPDFTVMSHVRKQPKTTVIYPEDTSEQDTGFYDTLMPVIGKTTVGKTTVKVIETKSAPQPTAAPIKVDVPSINKVPNGVEEAPQAAAAAAASTTPTTQPSSVSGSPKQQDEETLQSAPKTTAAEGGCCVVS